MKRRMITFRRILASGVTSFMRNATLAIAAIAVMTVNLTIVLFSLVTSATLNHTIAQISDKINISIYLNDAVTHEQRVDLMNQLRQLTEVKSLEYISKDQALAIYKAANANNAQLLAAINATGNPLPSSIQVNPRDPSQIDQIQTLLTQPSTVALEDAQAGTSYRGDRKAAIDKIAHATTIVKQVGVVAVGIFTLVSMLIIFNTIQMAIFNRRDEITIMRLLGATRGFIRGPFVVESIMYGVLSALISVALIDVLFVVASSTLQASSLGLLDIGYANSYFYDHFLLLLAVQLGAGIVIGAVSSTIATHRYLKFRIR